MVQQITDGSLENDFASIATSGDTVWVAWQGYRDKADTVFLRQYRNGNWDERLTVTERPGDLFMTAVAAGWRAGGRTCRSRSAARGGERVEGSHHRLW